MSYDNSKRDGWEFQYSVGEVAAAAMKREGYHAERAKHWRSERDAAEAELRERGIDFREYEVTGGKNVQAVVDPERQRHLNECAEKIQSHERRREEYDGFARTLAREDERNSGTLLLTVKDVLYFGLA